MRIKIKIQPIKLVIVLVAFFAVVIFPINSYADNWWGGYHWARQSNPFTLTVVDSNTTDWDDNLNMALSDWAGGSSVLDTFNKEQGDESRTARKRCEMISGKIHSCNALYGITGWLGLASINISGSHITQGISKVNDSYFKSAGYSETNKQHVMCQEIGHDLGLGHQDESGADLDTCMDYANALDNPSPNAHDFYMLDSVMYAHLDSTTTIGFNALSNPFADVTDDPNSWGRLTSQSANGRGSTYEREHFDGSTTATHVFWIREVAERCPGCDHRYQ